MAGFCGSSALLWQGFIGPVLYCGRVLSAQCPTVAGFYQSSALLWQGFIGPVPYHGRVLSVQCPAVAGLTAAADVDTELTTTRKKLQILMKTTIKPSTVLEMVSAYMLCGTCICTGLSNLRSSTAYVFMPNILSYPLHTTICPCTSVSVYYIFW